MIIHISFARGYPSYCSVYISLIIIWEHNKKLITSHLVNSGIDGDLVTVTNCQHQKVLASGGVLLMEVQSETP